ncbi:MAG TPA: serine hydrolase [Candidatus Limnocylindrales bacterium]|nr:serine hydrolase [Candidatus Limnocylindrales bacterium]
MSDNINSTIEGFRGTVSIFAKNLDTGKTFAIRPDDKVRTASTIKLAIMAATFQAVQEGKVKWTDFSILHDSEKVTGSGVIGNEFTDGDHLPLTDLVHLMIVVSDNTATNLVLNHVPADYVNDYMDKLGFKNTRSMRKVRGDGAILAEASGFSRAGKDPVNQKYGLGSTTPREMVGLVEKMERGEIVSPEASKEMIKILKRQQDHNGIARKFGETPVANKAGALDHLRSDVGIVYSKGGRIAIAITCDDIPQVDWSSDNPGLLMIAKLSEMLVAGLAK